MSTRNGTIVRWGLLAVLAGGLTARPAVATDQDVFNKFIAKVAVSEALSPFKPRVACVCLQATVGLERTGYLVFEGNSIVRCSVPNFKPDGSIAGLLFCDTYAVVGP
jgi:hypothetical protein